MRRCNRPASASSSIRDLATSVPIIVVEIPAAIVDKIGAPYVKATIPANTYNGQTAAVQTAAVVNYLVTRSGVTRRAGLPDDQGDLRQPAGTRGRACARPRRSSSKSALTGMPVPLHPGAERYFKEKGVMKQGS